MACKGCKEKQKTVKTARQQWDAKALMTISEAIAIVRKTNPLLADRLMRLNAELNELQVNEREGITPVAL